MIPAHAICPAVREVMESMYFLEPVYEGSGIPPNPHVGASLQFSGAFDGRFLVTVSHDTAVRMTAECLVLDPAEVSPSQAESAVKEFVNVTCGAALNAWMPGADFRLALPDLLTADETAATLPHCFSIGGSGIEVGFDLTVG